MSVLTADEWARFRSYVPTGIVADDVEGTSGSAAVQSRVDDLGSWHAAALEYLRAFESGLMVNPSSFSVPEYSESWGANFDLLHKRILELEGMVPAEEGGVAFGIGRMVRSDRGGGR